MSRPAASPDLALFEAHAATYDRINTIITFGQDARWRRWAAGEAVRRGAAVGRGAAEAAAVATAPSPRAPRLLDACAGTGLVGLAAAELGARVTLADASPLMLARARGRAAARRLAVDDVVVDLARGATPFAPADFDAVTLAFGLRYLPDPVATLRAFAAVLQPGGVVVALEAVVAPAPGNATTPAPGDAVTTASGIARTRAATAALRAATAVASFYFFRVAPRIGALLSGRRDLYDRLTRSVRELGGGDDLAGLFADAGLMVVDRRAWACGLIEGLVAERPSGAVAGVVVEQPPARAEAAVARRSPAPVGRAPDRQTRGSVSRRPSSPPPG